MVYAWSIVYFCTYIPVLTGLYVCMFRSIYMSTGTCLDWQMIFRHKGLVVVKPTHSKQLSLYLYRCSVLTHCLALYLTRLIYNVSSPTTGRVYTIYPE